MKNIINTVDYQVYNFTQSQIKDKIRDIIRTQIYYQIDEEVWSYIHNQVFDQVSTQVWFQTKNEILEVKL
jgi:hypothetical protein